MNGTAAPSRFGYGGYRTPKEPKRAIYYASTPKAILDTGRACEDSLARGLYFLSYLGGGRISESTKFRTGQVKVNTDEVLISLPVLKKRSQYLAALGREFPIPRGQYALCYENEMWDELWNVVKDWQPNMLGFDIWKRHMRLKSGEVREYSNMTKYLSRKIEIECEVVHKDRFGQWRKETITKPFHPHFMRHCRASHLADFYDMNEFQVSHFFKWSDPRMAAIYVKVKEMRDIIHGKAMAQNNMRIIEELRAELERTKKKLAMYQP